MTDVPLWYFAAFAFVIGAALGSFLNVCIYRWPAEESVIRPPSRCPGCGHGLAWSDNIPIAGWILLRGRCRYCANPVSVQYPLIELATALIWTGAVLHFGASLEALRAASFLTILLGIAMTDAREMVIPDQFSLGGLLLGLLFAAPPGGFPLLRAAGGAAFGYVLLWAIKLIAEKALKKPALGIGDIHMMAMVGAFTGVMGAALTLMLGALFGVIIGIPYTWAKGKLSPLGSYLPLGVFLAIAGAVTFFWGEMMMDWYVHAVLGM
jgi:leader peptidase (prepilin peptidase) / N-methyltransferase